MMYNEYMEINAIQKSLRYGIDVETRALGVLELLVMILF